MKKTTYFKRMDKLNGQYLDGLMKQMTYERRRTKLTRVYVAGRREAERKGLLSKLEGSFAPTEHNVRKLIRRTLK